MKTRRFSAVLACAALVAGLASPAAAERSDRKDRAGDGPVVADIRRLEIANRLAAVRITVRFEDLVARKTGKEFFVIDTERADGYDYILYTRWTKNGVKRRLIRAVPFSESDFHTIDCPALRLHWRPAKDRIDVVIPQGCLHRPTPLVRAGFSSSDKQSSTDWAPGQYATYGRWLDVG